MILSAQSIRERCVKHVMNMNRDWLPMLDPFCERTLHEPTGTSYGLGPCTYDVRLGQPVRLWPGDFVLAVTHERFVMPLDLCATVCDKSTWARQGVAVQNTHIDPGWRGWLTLELSNHGPDKLFLSIGTPIAQIKFEKLDYPTDIAYRGKYQDQGADPVPAIKERA